MDDHVVVWMATHRVAVLNDPAVWLGTIEKLGAVWVLLAVGLGLARRAGIGATLALAALTALTTFAADTAAFLVKDLTHRGRPFTAHPSIHPLYVVHSSSFPAGHAATAFAGALLLSWIEPKLAPALLGLAVLIGVSRIYVGVHYPTDVLGGAVLGAGVGALGILVLRVSGLRLAAPRGRYLPRTS